MENPLQSPALWPPARPRRPSRLLRRVLLVLLVVAGVLGAVLLAPPVEQPAVKAPAPAPGPAPGSVALTALSTGAPASLPGLTALIAERERHLRAQPRDAGAWAVLGAAYVERGRRTADEADHAKAEKALRTSLRLRPERNARALEGLAALANERRDFLAARSWGEKALRAEPGRWTAYAPLIDACIGLGDHEAAQDALDRLLRLHHSPAVMAKAAAVYRHRGWREDAAAQLSDAAASAASPVERAAYLEQAGDIAFERGNPEEALRYFDAALRLDPGRRTAAAGRGRTLAALGRTAEALRAYRRALAQRPRPEHLLELGELYQSLGRQQEAAAQYDLLRARIRRSTAAGVDDALVLGRFEADHGDPESAVRRLRAEWQRQPGTAVADALAWALHRTGRDEEALTFARKATETAGGGGVRNALYAYHRGMIERSLGRPGPARRHLEKALRTNPYFSPLAVSEAQTALAALGEPPVTGAPEDVTGR
ncbi:tetratricopeptide repeat protein [Streptomyces thermoalcalitolerans]|uniref:Tetratricopeptide repeat protein n=1 Tax=Streptomyces thermoalcalitolerans TaxID=65605 RepID=A0ABP4A8W5_9ACTN